jgi:hypothetical protein
MRGPFEPADRLPHPSATDTGPIDAAIGTSGSGGAAGTPPTTGSAVASAPEAAPSSPTAAKLEQIKDLYLTAEAIGEDALDRHFQQVSERQRQLIKEYFDQAIKGATDGGTV